MSCKQLDDAALEEGFLDKFDTVILDLDGVTWNGRTLLPKGAESCALLRKLGKKIIFLSNDDTQTREQKLGKIRQAGMEATIDEVFTSSYLAAQYAVLLEVPKDKKIYVMGLKSIAEEFQAEGYTCLPTGVETPPEDVIGWFHDAEFPKDPVGAVVIGLDIYFGFVKLVRACEYLKDEEVHFIGTFEDRFIQRPNLQLIPGPCGLLACVASASDRVPFVVSKPSPFAFTCITKVHPDIDPERCLVIGDSLESDIKFGNILSMTTLLVLTGTSNLDDVRRAQKHPDSVLQVPTYYTPSLETLHELLLRKTSDKE